MPFSLLLTNSLTGSGYPLGTYFLCMYLSSTNFLHYVIEEDSFKRASPLGNLNS